MKFLLASMKSVTSFKVYSESRIRSSVPAVLPLFNFSSVQCIDVFQNNFFIHNLLADQLLESQAAT
jgi:hypothetical protein